MTKQIRLKDKILKIVACEKNPPGTVDAKYSADCPCWLQDPNWGWGECSLEGSECKPGQSIPEDCPLEDADI